MKEHDWGMPLDEKHLAHFAENMAKDMKLSGRMSGHSVSRRLKRGVETVGLCKQAVAEWTDRGGTLPPAGEWLLDNWYLIQREGLEAAQSFRGAGKLRAVEHEAFVVKLAQVAVRAVPSMEESTQSCFLRYAQVAKPLTEQELALWAAALRGALTERLSNLCEVPARFHREDKLLAEEMERIVTAIRTLAAADLSRLAEEASLVDTLLRQDPAGVYSEMEEETRSRYRRQVCRRAKKLGIPESDLAREALEFAQQETGVRRHVGWFLFAKGEVQRRRTVAGYGYVGTIVLLTLFVSLLIGFTLHSAAVTFLLLLPASDIVKNCVDFLVARFLRPRPVHRLALLNGVPQEGKTLCVITALLTDEKSGSELAARLERYCLANRDSGENLLFGILADLPDSGEPMGREANRWVTLAADAVRALNQKYGGGFFLLFRKPSFQPKDERYMGWERKRGALLELCRLLRRQRGASLRVEAGDTGKLSGVRYVITLDSDTSLCAGTAREMIGAMLHPLNRPVIDHRRKIVTEGYGVLQPRVSVDLKSANRSQFSRIFAGQGGIDPYGFAASDVYHDLFDEGTYTGKGIFEVDACLTCLDRRFPQGKILSHDLLEGAYLRAGLLGDVELTDGYPGNVAAYYKRLHRWVRGDWQLLPWLGRTVWDEAGKKTENPISPLARWKLFDNLRRSLSPFSTLLALLLGICFSGRAFAFATMVAVLAALSNLLLSGVELAAHRGVGLHRRYHSTIIAGFGGVIVQTIVQILFLPCRAWVCMDAAVTALWRMYVTHRDLLAWTTSAETESKAGNRLSSSFGRMWSTVAIGGIAMIWADLPAGAAVGFLWAMSPLFAWLMSRPVRRNTRITPEDRAFLLHEGTLIWRYYTDFLREEDHYLPPDNWQEQPAAELARRTSPTNIGMALLGVLAAADLELCTRERAVELLTHMLDTMETLERWKGHLYNWYNTETLRPLVPRYVSTVDSGNLCGCLIALREGLYEWGEDALARRAETFSEEMDFSVLYDCRRRLFPIGYEVDKEEFSKGWYDLMASEARQTSYIAVARGEVPPRHWRRLGRMLIGENDYAGMASWTGTMFEYFMPNLLLPCEENSLMYESLAFCLYAQKRRVAARGMPWGISESCFYAFDGGFHYQYKAHGVQKLGLKRGMDKELVIAPYASFLALLLSPTSAGRNLRRLRDMGMEGKYGLYEAVDFTPSRCADGQRWMTVRSYMAHHLGMSLIAIDNTLRDGVMQRRFLRDPSMAAYRELLQERVPVGDPIIKSPRREVPEKPKRLSVPPFQRSGEGYRRLQPECHLLTNGDCSVLATDTGVALVRAGKIQMTAAQLHAGREPAGLSFFLRINGKLISLTPAPLYQEGVKYAWQFDGSAAAWSAGAGGVTCTCALHMPSDGAGLVWEVTVTGKEPLAGEFVCYLEPMLADMRDYWAHPAFSKLFLESVPTENGVLFTRRLREKQGKTGLCVLWDLPDVAVQTSREKALGRGGLGRLEQSLELPSSSWYGAMLDPCLLLRAPLSAGGGTQFKTRLVLSYDRDPNQAIELANTLLHGTKLVWSGYGEMLQRVLGMTRPCLVQSYELLGALVSPPERKGSRPPQSELWPYGISGDIPIALGSVTEAETEQGSEWIRQALFLTRSGWQFDLVLCMDEGGDYHRPVHTALAEALKCLGAEDRLGAFGGVHLLPQQPEAVEAWSTILLPVEEQERDAAKEEGKERSIALKPGVPAWKNENGTVTIQTTNRLPAVAWSQMLCNPRFGWMTDETGGGHLWLGNARENQLIPWNNDPLAIGGCETLQLCRESEKISAFADGGSEGCTVSYGPGFARWERRLGDRNIVTTAFVPLEGEERVILLETDGEGEVFYRAPGQELREPIQGELVLTSGPNESGTMLVSQMGAMTGEHARQLLEETTTWWKRRVASLRVETPDQELDDYLNGWALYQTIACRLFGRTSRYQNGGAYGFRDQLQDVCSTLLADGALAQEQILRACGRQFEEGDVQHWWHPPTGKGVRTRVSDDLMWLPYTVSQYRAAWGDDGMLMKDAPYLTSPVLASGEMERYEQPETAGSSASVYHHAVAAIECVLRRGRGAHGLALMGSGDWNDGMNRVGAAGTGESVWMTWFTALVLQRFAPLCGECGEPERGQRYQALAEEYTKAANEAWDGAWFLRGYYDDGTRLGSHESDQCRIDSVAQSFAVFVEGADELRARQAVKSAVDLLFDRSEGVVMLLTPPFDGGQDPGYIRGYVPGVRENGGQYTHAAVWLAMACLRLGMTDTGVEILHTLLPASHNMERYRAEPYVLAADVYENKDHAGRGGWSWYTGASGWYYQTAVQELLGIRRRDGFVFIEPNLPASWPGYSAVWETERAVFHVQVKRTGKPCVRLDGKVAQGGIRPEEHTGKHRLEVEF